MSQHHNHSHEHDHDHGHHHPAPEFNKAFLIASLANGLFVLFQIVFAFVANSTSLLADAFHNLGDVLGLIFSWVAIGLSKRLPNERTTYGLKKTSILAAFINGTLLVFTCGIIATDAIYKLFAPDFVVHAKAVMIVAGVGIVVNGSTALLFLKGSEDLNIRAAFLHLFYDALISVGVVISAALLYVTGWSWIDPVVGLLIAIIILRGTWTLFKDSLRLMLDGVPRAISWEAVRQELSTIPGVEGVHDLHIWALSTRENALSVHLWMPKDQLNDEERQKLIALLQKKYNIHHATVQVEVDTNFCENTCF